MQKGSVLPAEPPSGAIGTCSALSSNSVTITSSSNVTIVLRAGVERQMADVCTHLSFTLPLSLQWWSVSALRDIGHAIWRSESLMMISHAKCGAGGSQTRSDRCRRPRRLVILRPVSLGAHPSMFITTITGTEQTKNSLYFPYR
jgi:hypothetical protein